MSRCSFDTADLGLTRLVLLGECQLNFFEDGAGVGHATDMKLALSQTIFENMATNRVGGLAASVPRVA